jgi:glutathione S-transferase
MTGSADGTLVLYDLDHSPFAARVRIAIRHKRAPVALVRPPDGVRSEAYLRINPLGLVPALVTEDGAVLPESEIIVEYLDERFPEPPLLPEDAGRRARCRLIARVCDIYLAPALKELFERTKVPADVADTAALLAPVRHYLAVLDGLLEGRSHAVGDRLTSADCALAPLLFFAERCASLTPDAPLMPKTKLAAYWHEIKRHPSVAPVLEEMAESQIRRAAARARGEPED